MAQTQQQQQTEEQVIQLSKSGKSYRYQGRSYYLKKEYYRCDTQELFLEKCYTINAIQQEIQLKINDDLPSLLSLHNKIIYQRQLIYQKIQQIFVINRNIHIIFKHYGMRYYLNGFLSFDKNPFMYWVMVEAKDLLQLLSSSNIFGSNGENKHIYNQGIREAMLSIQIINEHLTFKREKMAALLPRLLGYRVDDNVGSIISQYCF